MIIRTRRCYKRALAGVAVTILPTIGFRQILRYVRAGVTLFRINLSHFKASDEAKWGKVLQFVERAAGADGVVLGIILDTPGPEFRVRNLDAQAASVMREDGRPYFEYLGRVRLTLEPGATTNTDQIAIAASADAEFRGNGGIARLCDGEYEVRIVKTRDRVLTVEAVEPIRVWEGAKLNFPNANLAAPAIGPKEKEAFDFFLERARHIAIDGYLFAQSFVRTANDVDQLRGVLNAFGVCDPVIIAKIETAEAVIPANLEGIVKSCAAVMIARGDLANETSRTAVPHDTREIVRIAQAEGKPVLLATQIYNSLKRTGKSQPARPEAEDVCSAVEQGIDAFVLTEEVVARKRPERVVEALLAQIASDEAYLLKRDRFKPLREWQRMAMAQRYRRRLAAGNVTQDELEDFSSLNFAIEAVCRANAERAAGVFAFTTRGRIVRSISKFYPEVPVFALTPSRETALELLLYRGVRPVVLEIADRELARFDVGNLERLVRKVAATLIRISAECPPTGLS